MVGLQTLDLAIGVRVPASQPNRFRHLPPSAHRRFTQIGMFSSSTSMDHRVFARFLVRVALN